MDGEKVVTALIIEDDPEDVLLLTELMAQSTWPSFRFVVECAETLAAGFKLLDKGGFEVILLDLTLPDSSGLDTLLRVRAKAPGIPIVVLTGLRDETLALEAISHGAQDYQVKGSVDGHALKRTVSYAVERHRSLERLRTVVDHALDAMVVLDAEDLIVYANPAAERFLAASGGPLLGQRFPYALPSRNESTETVLRRADGFESTAEVRVSAMEWNDAPARLVSLRDITTLRSIEQLKAEIAERRRMDKLKDELMNAISHEMRSPLTIIRAAIANLRDGLFGKLSAAQREMILMTNRNALRLERIVNNTLDLARLESGRAQIYLQRVDLEEVIRNAVDDFGLIARDKNITIREEIPKNLPPVLADPDLIAQALGNLVDNALRFTKTSIVLRAQSQEDGRRVRVSVIDDGAGIPVDRQGELFNKFVQINRKVGGGGYRGTGLGLAICKEIVQRQEGRLWVDSESGQGAAFHFELPFFEEALKQKKGADKGAPGRKGADSNDR